MPILRCHYIIVDSKKMVQLGLKQVEWNEGFKLYLFTRRLDVVLPVDISPFITKINFSVTNKGLESQVLDLILKVKKPELKEQKRSVIDREFDLKMKLEALESSLLEDLAQSQGNLLENKSLIDKLSEIKRQTAQIHESLNESHLIQAELELKSKEYFPIASKATLIYFIIKDLSNMNPTYQFSLPHFLSLFKTVLSQHDGEDTEELLLAIAQACISYVSIGLFKKDRIPFAMEVMRVLHSTRFPEGLWNIFIGRLAENEASIQLPPLFDTLDISLFRKAQAVDPAFISRLHLSETDLWSSVLAHSTPETVLFSRLEPMDLLLVIAVIRRDRLGMTMTKMVQSEMHMGPVSGLSTLTGLLSFPFETKSIVLITNGDVDPSMEVQALAHQTVGRDKFTQIALGGGKTDEAISELHRCASEGHWIFLKNLHLVLEWAPVLEKEYLALEVPHPMFKLWITTEEAEALPSVLLRESIKATVETPPGIKQNLINIYSSWLPEFINTQHPSDITSSLGPMSNPGSVIFLLACFHAVLQERRCYIPQGWLCYYDFSVVDLTLAVRTTLSVMKQYENIDWTTIRGMLECAIYGCKLENTLDIQIMQSLSDIFFRSKALSNPIYPDFPTNTDHSTCLQYMKSLPDTDQLSLLFLPPNSNKGVLEAQSLGYLSVLKNLHKAPVTSTITNWPDLLKPVRDVFKPHIDQISNFKFKYEVNTTRPLTPLDVFFQGEQSILMGLKGEVCAFYCSIESAITGLHSPLDPAMKLSAPMITADSPPEEWLNTLSAPTHSLSEWLGALHRKLDFVDQSLYHHLNSSLFEYPIALEHMLRPEVFLNALRQYTAQQMKVSLANLTLLACFERDSNIAFPNDSIVFSINSNQIAIQGAVVSTKGQLSEVLVSNPTYSNSVPHINIAWTPCTISFANTFSIPLYANLNKTSHIFSVTASCTLTDHNKWTTANVSLHLMQ